MEDSSVTGFSGGTNDTEMKMVIADEIKRG